MATDSAPEGFTFIRYADGSVVISHDGNAATLLRGERATAFLSEVASEGLQAVAARWTSKYRPGVVFVARTYPRKPVRKPPLT